MTGPARDRSEPQCVHDLLHKLAVTARPGQGDVTGPYLLDAVLEDVQVCPALKEGSAAVR